MKLFRIPEVLSSFAGVYELFESIQSDMASWLLASTCSD